MAPGVWLFGWPTREAHATQITSPVAALKACAKPLPTDEISRAQAMPRVQMPSLHDERLASIHTPPTSIHNPPTSICATQEAKTRRKDDSAAGPACRTAAARSSC